MSIDYKFYDFKIYEYLVRLQQELQGSICCPKSRHWLQQIAEAQERIRTHRFRVAVVGEFKRGKSSFINALLGKNVLPVDVSPATAIISRIIYGNVPRAYLYYKDGGNCEVEIERLADYVTKLTEESRENADKVQEAVIEYPSVFCQNYVDLIDTPGMNDDDMMNERTVAALDQIDLAIVAVSAGYPFSETECSFMVKLLESPAISQIVVAVTYIDTVRERDRERVLSYMKDRIKETVLERLKKFYDEGDSILQKYEMIFGDLHLFGVSCVDAMEAYETGDHELLENSGFLQLNKELPRLILSGQNNSALQRAMHTIECVIREYKKEYPLIVKKYGEMEAWIGNFKKNFAGGCHRQIVQSLENVKGRMFSRIDCFLQTTEEGMIKFFVNQILETAATEETLDIAKLCETVRECRRECQVMLRQCEAYLDIDLKKIYEQESRKGVQQLCVWLSDALKTFEGCFSGQQEKFVELPDVWSVPDIRESAVRFGWADAFLPWLYGPLEMKKIVARVKKVITKSLKYYCDAKKAEVLQICETECMAVRAEIKKIGDGVFTEIKRYETQMSGAAGMALLKEQAKSLEKIDSENKKLQKQFWSELNAG